MSFYKLFKDRSFRLKYSKNYYNSLYNKVFLYNEGLNLQSRKKKLLSMHTQKLFFSRLKNRCIYSNKPRSVFKKFGLSATQFRKFANMGLLVGIIRKR